jgi:hypothetical protein
MGWFMSSEFAPLWYEVSPPPPIVQDKAESKTQYGVFDSENRRVGTLRSHSRTYDERRIVDSRLELK